VSMKTFGLPFGAVVALFLLFGCTHGAKPPNPAELPATTSKTPTETFTGKVILAEAGYRLRLAKEPDSLLRLTRARKSSEFAAEQINLMKYYEKTIAVRGKRQDDWIWAADIVGQWLRPGEARGSNLLAPPMPNR
jgi:hypothetical protein